ncbi:MAG: helix-turn-helix transcriptional regulator [Candidatus Aenigmarchaeota archaeon]|nr:helix-turn-helix transcriptional regulator [Candidatus Aenigmarchaeota archaeon]
MPLKKIEKNNTVDCLWPYLLRILKDSPSHAYVLRKELETRFGFRVGKIISYKVLYSLTRKGYVTKKKDGRKQIYSITPEGRELLKKGIKFYYDRAKILE